MPKYRNTRTGRVVDVPDEAPTRRNRPKRDRQWASHLSRMARSKRWERIDGSDPIETEDVAGDADDGDSTGEPSAGEVRAWAKAEGIDVPARGKIPDEVVEQYKAAQRDNDGW